MTSTPANASFISIKRQMLENQRQALLEEYQAVSAQAAYTLSAADRLRMERQLRDLEQQITKTEAGLTALDQPLVGWSVSGSDTLPPASPLTPSQRNHLQQEHSELLQKYDSLTRAIAALDVDISRSLEEFRRQPLVERRSEKAAERDLVIAHMALIEATLGMADSNS